MSFVCAALVHPPVESVWSLCGVAFSFSFVGGAAFSSCHLVGGAAFWVVVISLLLLKWC